MLNNDLIHKYKEGRCNAVVNLSDCDPWMPVKVEFETQSKAPVVSQVKKLHTHCLVLVVPGTGLSVIYILKQTIFFHNQA